jgi:hypothetical protein
MTPHGKANHCTHTRPPQRFSPRLCEHRTTTSADYLHLFGILDKLSIPQRTPRYASPRGATQLLRAAPSGTAQRCARAFPAQLILFRCVGVALAGGAAAMKVFEIAFACGKAAICDEQDAATVGRHTWHFSVNYRGGYAATKVGKKTLYMHRLIAKARRGEIVDHINRDKLDNRRCNLRIATPSENAANQRSSVTNSTGYRGVFRHRSGFRSQVYIKRMPVRGRTRRTAVEAARDYDALASLHYGEFAQLNFGGADA